MSEKTKSKDLEEESQNKGGSISEPYYLQILYNIFYLFWIYLFILHLWVWH